MFWERFYELCEKRQKKPLQIVTELNIASGSITKWKNGSIPSGTNLCLIADYFNVSIDYLLGRTNIKSIGYEDSNLVQKIYDSLLKEKNGELKLKILFMKLGESEKRSEELVFFVKHREEFSRPIFDELGHIEQDEISEEQWEDQFKNQEHPEIRLKRIKELEEELAKLENEDKQ